MIMGAVTIKTTCPNCGEIIIIKHGRIYHYRPGRNGDKKKEKDKKGKKKLLSTDPGSQFGKTRQEV